MRLNQYPLIYEAIEEICYDNDISCPGGNSVLPTGWIKEFALGEVQARTMKKEELFLLATGEMQRQDEIVERYHCVTLNSILVSFFNGEIWK